MIKFQIRESYKMIALIELEKVLRGRYTCDFVIEPKGADRPYNRLYAVQEKSDDRNVNHLFGQNVNRMREYAHIWVGAYEWGYEQGHEDGFEAGKHQTLDTL